MLLFTVYKCQKGKIRRVCNRVMLNDVKHARCNYWSCKFHGFSSVTNNVNKNGNSLEFTFSSASLQLCFRLWLWWRSSVSIDVRKDWREQSIEMQRDILADCRVTPLDTIFTFTLEACTSRTADEKQTCTSLCIQVSVPVFAAKTDFYRMCQLMRFYRRLQDRQNALYCISLIIKAERW